MTRLTFLKTLGIRGLLILPVGAYAQRVGRWEYLGEANIDGGSDHDRIRVGRGKGTFRRIQILVQKGAVVFDRLAVHYGDGSSFPAAIAGRVPAGGRTREIDLPGASRVIESVEVWYQRGNWGNAKPKIRLMGIH